MQAQVDIIVLGGMGLKYDDYLFFRDTLEKSGAMELPKHSTLMHPNDYTRLEELRCVYKGTLAGLPQRQQMEFDQNDTVIGVYLGLALGLFHTGAARVRAIF